MVWADVPRESTERKLDLVENQRVTVQRRRGGGGGGAGAGAAGGRASVRGGKRDWSVA